jgi:hypothetical protein
MKFSFKNVKFILLFVMIAAGVISTFELSAMSNQEAESTSGEKSIADHQNSPGIWPSDHQNSPGIWPS